MKKPNKKEPQWIAIRKSAPAPGSQVFVGAKKHGLWRFGFVIVRPDATQVSMLAEDTVTHWAQVPDWLLAGPIDPPYTFPVKKAKKRAKK